MSESMESAVNAAFAAVIEWQKEAREALWRAPSRRQVEATIRAQFERAESAEAALGRVRALAEEWAAQAPSDDWGESMHATVVADAGRAVLAVIKGSSEEGEGSG